MIGTHSTKSARLNTLVAALGAEPKRPREREDGLSDIIPLGEDDSACVTAAGENAAVITIVTTTEKGRRLLRAIARFYGIQPAGGEA